MHFGKTPDHFWIDDHFRSGADYFPHPFFRCNPRLDSWLFSHRLFLFAPGRRLVEGGLSVER